MKTIASRSLTILFIVVFFTNTVLHAAQTAFIREYTYRASEADSKQSCREAALKQVRALLLNETGAYVESTLKNEKREDAQGVNSITSEDITSISGGLTKTEILEEKWNGTEYYLKAEIKIDEEDLKQRIEGIHVARQAEQKQKEEAAKVALAVQEAQLAEIRSNAINAGEVDRLKRDMVEMREYVNNTNVAQATVKPKKSVLFLVFGILALGGGASIMGAPKK
jgi:alpha-galactosidase/6-phospho-beta-glucosidase family protein